MTEDIKSASVGNVKNQIYTGKQIQPAIKVTLNGKTLKAGKDYTVTYTDNKNTGLAKATINGIGKYTGTQTVTFKIVPKKAVLKNCESRKIRNSHCYDRKSRWKKFPAMQFRFPQILHSKR